MDIRTKTDGGISPALYVAGCIMPGQRRRFKTKDSAVSEVRHYITSHYITRTLVHLQMDDSDETKKKVI